MSDKEEDSQQRKYISLIQKVGSCHNYQYIIFFIMATINILEAGVIFMLPYLLHQQSYSCAGLQSDECTKKVCSMKISQRHRYLTNSSPFFSLADQLGDFRCQRNHQLTTIQSLPFLGALIGMFLFLLFTQKLGRKHSLLISMVLSLLGMFIIFFSNNIQMAGVGVFITFMGTQNALQFTPCYGTQVVSQKWRPIFITLIFFANGIGIMLNSLTYYSIKDWRTVFLFFYIVPVIAVIVGIVTYVQKTPIDLLATENTQDIICALNRIAVKNGIENADLQQDSIQNLRLEYNNQSKDESFSVLDLCKFASLRKIIIPLVIANFVSNYLFYAPSFIQDSQNTDLFLDNIISGISNMLSCLFVFFALKLLQRRKTQFFLCLFISLLSLCMTMSFVKDKLALKSLLYFLFRLVLSIQDNIIFVLNFQSFPTQIRATAGMMCYISGELAGVAQPWAIKFFKSHKININSTFIVFGLINFLTAYFFKQTFGVPPQQIIQQLHHSQDSKQFKDEFNQEKTVPKKMKNENYSKLEEFQEQI